VKQRAARIVKALARTYPDAECALKHATPFQLLVATILSAQCTDERVNAVTPHLFARYPDAATLAAADQSDVAEIIHSLGFFRAKAANIIGMAKGLCTRFGGVIPRSVEELTSLAGVGRKTANVVLGTAFGIATGVVVDTHVRRISGLLGLTSNTDPEKIERDLMEILPRDEWVMYSHRVIHHGRRICIARRPKCTECPLLAICPRVGLPPLSVS
jgi:endonuclease-3